MTELILCDELRNWCNEKSLPFLSASELLHEDVIAESDKQYLINFIERWDSITNLKGELK